MSKLKAFGLALGLGVASIFKHESKSLEAKTRIEETERAQFEKMMQRLMAHEFHMTRPKWVGKPRLSIQEMMQRDFYSKVTGAPAVKLTSNRTESGINQDG